MFIMSSVNQYLPKFNNSIKQFSYFRKYQTLLAHETLNLNHLQLHTIISSVYRYKFSFYHCLAIVRQEQITTNKEKNNKIVKSFEQSLSDSQTANARKNVLSIALKTDK